MIRLLHAADLHLDSSFSGVSQQQALLLRRESRDTVRRLVDWGNDHAVDVLLLAGDLFDSDRLFSQTAETLAASFARFRGEIFIAPGNHDFYAPGGSYHGVKWPKNVHLFTSAQAQTVTLPALGVCVTGMAFTMPEERTAFAGAAFTGGEAAIRLGVLHGDVTRQESKYRAIDPAEIEKTGLTYLALGHTHRFDGVHSAGRTQYAYSGCLMGRGFDETGDKGFLYGTVDEAGAKLEFIPFAACRYQSITVDISEQNPAEAVRLALPAGSENDICRVRLSGTRGEDFSLAQLQRELEGACRELELTDDTRAAEDIWARCGEDSLRGLFLQELRGQLARTADEAARKKIILAAQYGLAALDGRDM